MKFEKIWNVEKIHLKNFISTKLPATQVDDVLQEVSLAFLEQLNKSSEIEKPKKWLFQVARNKIALYYKKKQRGNELDTIYAASVQKEFEPCICDNIELLLNKMLPEKFSRPLILSALYNTPQKEIADQLNLSYVNTKSRIQRARKIFKSKLENFADIEFNANGQFLNYKLKNENKIPQEIQEIIKKIDLYQ